MSRTPENRNGPLTPCIHQIVEDRVSQAPGSIAVTFGDTSLTYCDINAWANRLARRLRALGVGPDVPVGLYVERSVETLVGILGILKAGGAYLPLDPEYPQDHLAFVLQDAQVRVVVSQQHLIKLAVAGWPSSPSIVAIESCSGDDDETAPGNLPVIGDAGSLAYVMYTSGSTGRPKGVMVTHRNLVHSTDTRRAFYGDDVASFLLLPSFAFDASAAAIFWTLCAGGRLILPPRTAERKLPAVCRLIAREQVSHLLCVSSLYGRILERAGPSELSSLKVAIIGGETSPAGLVGRHREKAPGARLFNEYGTTECTVWSSVYEVSDAAEDESLPIGRQIPGTRVHILDADLRAVPVGVPGELYIEGESVARGYLNRPELTAERFLESPLGAGGGRLFKTGDLGQYRADGNIDFLGRLDHQVKIDGCRVEPEEIETALARHPSVENAVIAALEDARGGKGLVAYVVKRAGDTPTGGDLRTFLRRTLPEFMVPREFVFLDALPLTVAGKVNRRALPPLKYDEPQVDRSPDPLTPLEAELRELWEEVFGVRPLGFHDNFFELGGHSLLAAEMLTRLETLTGTQLTLDSLLEGPTIRQLAALLGQTRPRVISPLVPIQPHGSKPPLFCMPGGGGSALGLEPLRRHLGPEQPIYALVEAGLANSGQAGELRIEDLASCYLREIRAVQPSGPYLIGGYSFGGVIAFEVALRLTAQGESVPLLALFDTPNPRAHRLATFAWRARRKVRFHLERLERGLERVVQGPERLAYLRQKAIEKTRRRTAAAWVKSPHLLALERYVPRAFAGRLTLFRAEVRPIDDSHDPLLGWKPHAAGGIELYQVPGDHDRLFREPQVRVLASQLSACIDRALDGGACLVAPRSTALPEAAALR